MSVRNPNAPPGEPPKVFTFDATYGPECVSSGGAGEAATDQNRTPPWRRRSTQVQIYEKTAAPIIGARERWSVGAAPCG